MLATTMSAALTSRWSAGWAGSWWHHGWLAVTALRLIVVLGDALTGETSPELLAVSLGCAAIGVLGLIVEARSPSPRALG